MLESINYKRPLVIGTGGGNDIVSACLIVSELKRNGADADLAGICSPGAWHVYSNNHKEGCINCVTENARRFIPAKTPQNISFIDSKIPQILKKEGIESNVYNLSCRYGTSNLIENLKNLTNKNKYDGIVAVDVGGDILARARKDNTILSPLMDFTTLYSISKLELPTVLIEFGLQTDGELRPKGCEEILEELKVNNVILSEERLNNDMESVNQFKRIYDGVKEIRHGHTAAMTLETLQAEENINTEYRFIVKVLDKKAVHSFPLTLEAKYFGKVFILDAKKLAEKRELAFPYKNTLELFIKTKEIIDTKTEMDLLYNNDLGICLWLGMMAPQLENSKKKELLNYGLENLDSHADAALLWKKDVEQLNLNLLKENDNIKDFIVTSNLDNKTKLIKDNLEKIL